MPGSIKWLHLLYFAEHLDLSGTISPVVLPVSLWPACKEGISSFHVRGIIQLLLQLLALSPTFLSLIRALAFRLSISASPVTDGLLFWATWLLFCSHCLISGGKVLEHLPLWQGWGWWKNLIEEKHWQLSLEEKGGLERQRKELLLYPCWKTTPKLLIRAAIQSLISTRLERDKVWSC